MNPQAAARILVWDKIRNVFSDEVENEFTRGEIIALVVEDTPIPIERALSLPGYCYNMINKGINFQNHVFEQIETGHCKVPGTNYDYVGPIFLEM